jgi:hypothetical protein
VFNAFKSSALALAILAAAVSAHATQPGNNGGGQGGCGQGQTTNGCAGQGGAGGAGGQATAGAVGVGVGVGIGVGGKAEAAAAVVGSGNSRNRNTNRNANTNQLNAGSSYSQSGGNVLNNEGSRVTVEGDKGGTYYAPAQERNPVATAYAAPLTSSNGTCMGSSSAGGQGSAFGLSIGTTWTDANCDIRYDAIALREAGLADAAKFRLCQKPDLRKAIEASGGSCEPRKTASAAPPVVVGTGNSSGVGSGGTGSTVSQYQDPIIRARLGLPPL